MGLVSCKKKSEEPTTVNFYLHNPVSGEPYEGVEVIIGREKIGAPGSTDGAGGKVIERTTSNADGNYSMQFRQKKSRSYALGFNFDHEKYYNLTSENQNVSAGGGKTFDLQLIPFGFLKGIINNENCFDTNDLLSVQRFYDFNQNFYGTEFSNYLGCYHYEFSGSIDGSPQGYIYAPMGWHYLKGTVTKNNITTQIHDSIYIEEGGYHTWSIDY